MCWRCEEEEVYENGLCYNCWAECAEAVEKEKNNTFEDGEPR